MLSGSWRQEITVNVTIIYSIFNLPLSAEYAFLYGKFGAGVLSTVKRPCTVSNCPICKKQHSSHLHCTNILLAVEDESTCEISCSVFCSGPSLSSLDGVQSSAHI